MRSWLASSALVLALMGGTAAAADEPPVAHPDEKIRPISDDNMQQPEGRSGFWTSRAPAKGGAYRWRLLGVGVFLVGVTGIVMLRMVKNTRSANAEKPRGPRWKNEPVLPKQD